MIYVICGHNTLIKMAELNFKQELVGCYGFPVSENPTQAMIEPAFQDMGLEWRYLTLEVKPDGLRGAVEAARVFGFKGFNCTIGMHVSIFVKIFCLKLS